MKKNNLYLFVISISILVFIFSFNCFAQNEEKFNWGKSWLDMDSIGRKHFFLGARDGIFCFILNLMSDNSTSGISNLSNSEEELFFDYTYKMYSEFHENMDVLIDIVTSLYKYPENSYIKYPYMMYIAIKKLKGEPIEKFLEEQRKDAYENN